MLNDPPTDDILDMESDVLSRSSNSSCSSSVSCLRQSIQQINTAKSNGNQQANELLQLTRDNMMLAVQLKATKAVACQVNKIHLFLQNRFRDHLRIEIFPQMIANISASVSTSSSAETATPNVSEIQIDCKKFIEDLEDAVRSVDQVLTIHAKDEARAIKLFMVKVDRLMLNSGFPSHTITGVKIQLLKLQSDFIDYLSVTDARIRMMNARR